MKRHKPHESRQHTHTRACLQQTNRGFCLQHNLFELVRHIDVGCLFKCTLYLTHTTHTPHTHKHHLTPHTHPPHTPHTHTHPHPLTHTHTPHTPHTHHTHTTHTSHRTPSLRWDQQRADWVEEEEEEEEEEEPHGKENRTALKSNS